MNLKKIAISCLVITLSLLTTLNSANSEDFSAIKIVPPPEIYNLDEIIKLDSKREIIKKDVSIGFILDGPSHVNNTITNIFKNEITDLLENEYNVSFPEDKTLVADWTCETITAKANDLLNDKDVDIIIPLGFLSADCTINLKNYPKPVIIPLVFKMEKPLENQDISNIENLNFIRYKQKDKKDLQTFYEIYPFNSLAVLINQDLKNIYPDLETTIKKDLPDKQFTVKVIPVDNQNVDNAIHEITNNIDAVYVAPLTNISIDQFRYLADKLIEKKLPSFSYLGTKDVERGILATITPFQAYKKIARQTAINTQRILMGEKASDLPTNYKIRGRLALNIETASKIGYQPNWKIRTEADYISEEQPETDKYLSLDSVIDESMNSNLEVKAKAYDIITSLKQVKEARSDLLPQAEAQMGWVKFGSGITQQTGGMISPHTLFSSVSLNQLIYSDKPYANMKIKKFVHESKKEDQKSLELNVALDSANIYLDLLMAKNLLKIQRKNIEISRHNLELAEARKEIGTSGPSDIYRWKAEIAKNKQSVIGAEANLKAQKILLNRILNHPQNEEFTTEETDLKDPLLLSNRENIVKYLEDPEIHENFVHFVVGEGLEYSPEIKTLEYGIKAKQREISAVKRSFWTPDIGFQLNYSALTQDDVSSVRNSYFFGITGSLPIFKGGKRIYQLGRVKKELEQLQVQKENLEQQLEKRIRLSLVKTGSTYPNIQLSNEVAINSHKALDLVTDNYKEGTASLIDLLDAQNAAITADQLAANSVYEFIKSLIGFQRALGKVKFNLTDKEWNEWLYKFEQTENNKTNF